MRARRPLCSASLSLVGNGPPPLLAPLFLQWPRFFLDCARLEPFLSQRHEGVAKRRAPSSLRSFAFFGSGSSPSIGWTFPSANLAPPRPRALGVLGVTEAAGDFGSLTSPASAVAPAPKGAPSSCAASLGCKGCVRFTLHVASLRSPKHRNEGSGLNSRRLRRWLLTQ